MLSSALFFTFAIHQATALSLPTLPEKNTLVARQGNGAFVIRTDLKQDNDWDRERGGQSCNGKFKYVGPGGSIVDSNNRDSAVKCNPRAPQYTKPEGLPFGGGKMSLSVKEKPFGEDFTAFNLDFSGGDNSAGTIYILGADNKNEIKAKDITPPDWYDTQLSWDSWLVCNGKLEWLAYDTNPRLGIILPYNQGCQAVRLYAEPVDAPFKPDPNTLSADEYKYYSDCLAKLNGGDGNSTVPASTAGKPANGTDTQGGNSRNLLEEQET